VQGKRIERGTTLQIDANLPDTAHNPDLVATVERIHSKHANYDTQACKLLGIYLDEHLNLNHNTARLTFNLSRACFFINRAKNILSPKALKTLYTSFFLTFYIAPTYMHAPDANTTAIFRQLEKAIRILAKADCLEHTAPLFESLSILSLEKIILQARVTFMHTSTTMHPLLSITHGLHMHNAT
jgi:hypothetical protein